MNKIVSIAALKEIIFNRLEAIPPSLLQPQSNIVISKS